MMREWPYTAQVAIYWVVQPLEASGDMSQLLKEIGFVNSQVLPKNGINGIHGISIDYSWQSSWN